MWTTVKKSTKKSSFVRRVSVFYGNPASSVVTTLQSISANNVLLLSFEFPEKYANNLVRKRIIKFLKLNFDAISGWCHVRTYVGDAISPKISWFFLVYSRNSVYIYFEKILDVRSNILLQVSISISHKIRTNI